MHISVRKALYGKKGIILLNAALLIEHNLTHLCNNDIVLVTVDPEEQRRRLIKRGLTASQIERRINSQYSTDRKKEAMSKNFRTIIHRSPDTSAQRTFEDIKSL